MSGVPNTLQNFQKLSVARVKNSTLVSFQNKIYTLTHRRKNIWTIYHANFRKSFFLLHYITLCSFNFLVKADMPVICFNSDMLENRILGYLFISYKFTTYKSGAKPQTRFIGHRLSAGNWSCTKTVGGIFKPHLLFPLCH